MTSRTLGIVLAPFTPDLGTWPALPAADRPKPKQAPKTNQTCPCITSDWKLPVNTQPFTVDLPQTTLDDPLQQLAASASR
jgi:hypothetical protein